MNIIFMEAASKILYLPALLILDVITEWEKAKQIASAEKPVG